MVKAWPTLASDEFAEACHQLEVNASSRLDGTDWLSLTWDKTGAMLIKKQVHLEETNKRQDEDEDEAYEERDIIEPEDQSTLIRLGPPSGILVVDFSIVMSPTYQVPVLWFVLNGLPRNGPQGIDAVYQYLIPAASHVALKCVGVMGGVSMANHPISGLPAFFIHPCNTHEALMALQTSDTFSSIQYLMLWLGLLGPAVGLYIPSQLVLLDH